jgi:outer membrane lipoprotein-sorting protein
MRFASAPLAACAVFLFVCAAPARPARATTPEGLLRQVQGAYAKGGDFEATFTQTYFDALSGRSRQEDGRMWVKADGRVRFSYLRPEPKDFVFDGNTAYFYEPQNAQVTVFKQFADSPVAQAMQFLWGQGSLAQLFEAVPCPAAGDSGNGCLPAEANSQSLQLRPRQPLPTVEHIILSIDTGRGQVRRSVVYDALRNETRYVFGDVTFVPPIASSRFAFAIPSGVSVLQAPPMAASSAPHPDRPAPTAP